MVSSRLDSHQAVQGSNSITSQILFHLSSLDKFINLFQMSLLSSTMQKYWLLIDKVLQLNSNFYGPTLYSRALDKYTFKTEANYPQKLH